MKLLSSSFSSSSSTTSFDSKSPTASCLTGILRRIFCSGTLPTYPADHVTEDTNSSKSFRHDKILRNKPDDGETNPGLVARLMGLDSMPETNFRTTISRSRSMNSADRLNDNEAKAGLHHRRVKSTASFRDVMPVFLELESDEFYILSFESVSEKREIQSMGRKLESGFGELKQCGRSNSKRLENRAAKPAKKEDRERKRTVLSDLNGKENTRRNSKFSLVDKKIPCQKQKVVGTEAAKPWKPNNSDNLVYSNRVTKKKKKNNSQLVNSEDSSPDSVLNYCQFLIDPEVPIPENDCSSATTCSRRKLSLETKDDQSPRRDENLIGGEERKSEAKRSKYVTDCHESSSCSSDVLEEIWRLSEAELLRPSWVRNWTFDCEDFRGVGEELEALILGQLIEELVETI